MDVLISREGRMPGAMTYAAVGQDARSGHSLSECNKYINLFSNHTVNNSLERLTDEFRFKYGTQATAGLESCNKRGASVDESNASLSIVCEIMTDFASQTGLAPAVKMPRRYLWTDAFAVCNFLELNRQTNEDKYQQPALGLVDQVHYILGHHRDDAIEALIRDRSVMSAIAANE